MIESEVLEIARGGGVMSKVVIGLETESASDRGRDFTLKVLVTLGIMSDVTNKESQIEQYLRDKEFTSEETLDVELGVERGRCGIESRPGTLQMKSSEIRA
jgi:hypothetical protein